MVPVVAFVAGLVFALGLGFSELVRPATVLGAIDWLGDFDPTLMIVFVVSTAVYTPFFVLARRRTLLAARCDLPRRTDVDARLVTGAAIFGVGWGLAGICPGPAVVWLPTGSLGAVVFTAAMLLGMTAHRLLLGRPTNDATTEPRTALAPPP